MVLVTFWLDSVKQPLVHRRETRSHFFGRQPEQINDHDMARRGGQVAAVAVEADVAFQAWRAAQA